MNFSKDQLERVYALREEFVEKLKVFADGVRYGKEIYAPNGKEKDITWIEKVICATNEFQIEKSMLGDVYIPTLQENSFYKVLGEYFKKIEEAFYKKDGEIVKPFDIYFFNYKKQIISLLVM